MSRAACIPVISFLLGSASASPTSTRTTMGRAMSEGQVKNNDAAVSLVQVKSSDVTRVIEALKEDHNAAQEFYADAEVDDEKTSRNEPPPSKGKCTKTANAAISGHNRQRLSGKSVVECESACLSTSWCKSFDYGKKRCDLSDKDASDVGGLKTNYRGNPYDHYDCPKGTSPTPSTPSPAPPPPPSPAPPPPPSPTPEGALVPTLGNAVPRPVKKSPHGSCTKWSREGWNRGKNIGGRKGMGIPGKDDPKVWTWQDCADKCARIPECTFWCLKGNWSCSVKKHKSRRFFKTPGHIQGGKSLNCLTPGPHPRDITYSGKAPKADLTPPEEPWASLKGMSHSIQRYLSMGHCPPWGTKRGRLKCKRDSLNLAVRFIRPANRCGPNGECPGSSCVVYNNKAFYPENSPAGFCIKASAGHYIAYVEYTILAVRGNDKDWTGSARWAQRDSPERLTCKSFCSGGGTNGTIAQYEGKHGYCNCHCMGGSAASDFDRCKTLEKNLCTDAVYCGGNGKATFKPKSKCFDPVSGMYYDCPNEGTCSCECKEGYTGRNCELAPGTPCDINDCNHRTHKVSGTRPNCKCECGYFGGPRCADWRWHKNHGTNPATSSAFTIQKR